MRFNFCPHVNYLIVAALLALGWPMTSDAYSVQYSNYESPPGMNIWRGNYNNHIYCTGEGMPTVILEAGLGGNTLEWVLVQPEIARYTRVCSYDRAGYGWSKIGPLPRSISRIVEELDTLLTLSGEPPPYLLTGHSFGGLINQVYASQYREKVAGMVLVDSSNLQQFTRLESGPNGTRLTPTNSNFVLFNSTIIPDSLPEEYQLLARQLASANKSIRTLYSELGNFRNSVDLLNSVGIQETNIPVVVISRGPGSESKKISANSKRRETVWHQLQRDLASKNDTTLVVSESSDHHVHLSDPDLVINAVKSVLIDVRKAGL